MPKREVSSVLIALALVGSATAVGAQPAGKAIPRPLDYYNVTFNQVVSVYKQAYLDAGFDFKTLVKLEPDENNNQTELIFERVNPVAPHKKKAIKTFIIASASSGTQLCAPCSIYGGTFFVGDLAEYTSEEYALFRKQLSAADRQASAQIRRLMGQSFEP